MPISRLMRKCLSIFQWYIILICFLFSFLVIIMNSWLFVCTGCFSQMSGLYFLMLKLSYICPVGAPSSWLLCPFDKTWLLAFIASYFWHNKIFLVHLVHFLYQIWSLLFLWRSMVLFFFLEKWYKAYSMGLKITATKIFAFWKIEGKVSINYNSNVRL